LLILPAVADIVTYSCVTPVLNVNADTSVDIVDVATPVAIIDVAATPFASNVATPVVIADDTVPVSTDVFTTISTSAAIEDVYTIL
jgi:hypothetical protein